VSYISDSAPNGVVITYSYEGFLKLRPAYIALYEVGIYVDRGVSGVEYTPRRLPIYDSRDNKIGKDKRYIGYTYKFERRYSRYLILLGFFDPALFLRR
jgi:hypothetical protein